MQEISKLCVITNGDCKLDYALQTMTSCRPCFNRECHARRACERALLKPPSPDPKVVETLTYMPANLSMRDFAAETHQVVVPCVIFSAPETSV